MNINDIKEPDLIPTCIITDIFERQVGLMGKYRDIEVKNGFHYPLHLPLNLHDKKDQHLLKDFKWRVTEELSEALEASKLGDKIHFLEELSDALHFMVELSILSGLKPPRILSTCPKRVSGEAWELDEIDHIYNTIYNLGIAANCLKNKPWKNHHILTDINKYHSLLAMAFKHLLWSFESSGCDDADIYSLYFRKNGVNKFRIKSNY